MAHNTTDLLRCTLYFPTLCGSTTDTFPGLPFPTHNANHSSSLRSNCSARCVFSLCFRMIRCADALTIGFVLAGIPVYYLTQRSDDGDPPRIISKSNLHSSQATCLDRETSPITGWFSSIVARIRGRPSVGGGWQAVAGDENVEMSEPLRTSR